MDRYTKAFIIASLVYLLAGSILGLLIGVNDAFNSFYFTHVHLNLLGFMAMMIYGVGYFILPRFNARTLRWPGLVPWHFYSANIGLLGMCILYQARIDYGTPLASYAFAFFAAIEILSVVFFVVNLIATLTSSATVIARQTALTGAGVLAGAREGAAAGPGRATRPGYASPHPEVAGKSASSDRVFKISPDVRIGEILERFPRARFILVDEGIRALASEAHAEQVKKMPVTLGTACRKHGVDMNLLTEKLERFIAGEEDLAREPSTPSPQPAGQTASSSEEITPDMRIGDTLAKFPSTKEVFMRYFGSGCFDCPGQEVESIEQGALMHNVDSNELVRALNEAVGRF